MTWLGDGGGVEGVTGLWFGMTGVWFGDGEVLARGWRGVAGSFGDLCVVGSAVSDLCAVPPLGRPFPLTPGSSPGQALAVSRGGERGFWPCPAPRDGRAIR